MQLRSGISELERKYADTQADLKRVEAENADMAVSKGGDIAIGKGIKAS